MVIIGTASNAPRRQIENNKAAMVPTTTTKKSQRTKYGVRASVAGNNALMGYSLSVE